MKFRMEPIKVKGAMADPRSLSRPLPNGATVTVAMVAQLHILYVPQ